MTDPTLRSAHLFTLTLQVDPNMHGCRRDALWPPPHRHRHGRHLRGRGTARHGAAVAGRRLAAAATRRHPAARRAADAQDRRRPSRLHELSRHAARPGLGDRAAQQGREGRSQPVLLPRHAVVRDRVGEVPLPQPHRLRRRPAGASRPGRSTRCSRSSDDRPLDPRSVRRRRPCAHDDAGPRHAADRIAQREPGQGGGLRHACRHPGRHLLPCAGGGLRPVAALPDRAACLRRRALRRRGLPALSRLEDRSIRHCHDRAGGRS